MTPPDATHPGAGAETIPGMAPPPPVLLDRALDHIAAEHMRQRNLCAHLRRIAEERQATRGEADAIVAFFKSDLALQHADVTEDLYPAVRRRAVPEDDLAPILDQLTGDHRDIAVRAARIVAALGRHRTGTSVPVSRQCAVAMFAYAKAMHRLLSAENGIVLVIARKRLTPGDLAAMSQSMKVRRGVAT